VVYIGEVVTKNVTPMYCIENNEIIRRINKMSYSKEKLIKRIIEFKDNYGRIPTREDFKAKRITPSHTTFHRIFGDWKNMIRELELYEKEELVFDDKEKNFENQPMYTCPYCDSQIQQPIYSDSLRIIITMRLIGLLNKNGNRDYANAVFDFFIAVFRRGNPEVEEALRKEGLFKAYLKRLEDTNSHKEIYNSESRN